MWCETLPPGNHLRTRERLRARGGADEGRRVHERGDEPAGVWERHGAARRRVVARRRRCWTGTVAGGHPIRAGPGRTGAAVEKARAGRRGRGRGGPWVIGGRLPAPTARGGRDGGRDGGSRGSRGSRGCEGGPVGRGRWEDWGRARERTNERRGAGNGGRGNSPVRGGPCARSVSGGGHQGGSKPGGEPEHQA